MQGETRRAFRLLFLCLVSTGMGQAMLFAILPPAAREVGLSPVQVSTIFVVSAVFWALMSPRWGRLSDRIGRRRVILIGLLGYAVSMILLAAVIGLTLEGVWAVSVAWPAMIAARCVFGIFGSAAPPAAQAFVADRTSPEDRAAGVALINAAFGVGQTLGPAVGAGLAVFGLLAPIYFSALLAIVSALVIFFRLPESQVQVADPDHPRANLRLLDARIRPFFLLQIFMQAVRAVTMITLAFFLQDQLGLDPDQTGQYAGIGFMVLAMAGLVSQLFIVQRVRPAPWMMIQGGLASCGVGFALLFAGSNFPVYLGGLAFLGLGLGLVRPGNAAASSMAVAADEQGAVAGYLNSVGVTGNMVGPLVGGLLYDLGPSWPVALNLALMVLGLAYAMVHPRIRRASHRSLGPGGSAEK
jgi:MFS family permease